MSVSAASASHAVVREAVAAPNAAVTIAGVELTADPAGALYWPEHRLLAVADLHLEKGSSYAARGVLLPPYDTAATLARLAVLVARYQPRVVVALGDSFHDGRGPARLADTDRATLRGMQRGRDWVWISGNHDPDPAENIGGRFLAKLELGALTLPPRAGGERRRRDRRPSASGGASIAPRPHRQPPLLCCRRRAPGNAGIRRLCRRAQRARPRLCDDIPDARLHRAYAGRAAGLCRRRQALPAGLAHELTNRPNARPARVRYAR